MEFKLNEERNNLELEDYIALKQKTYDFIANGDINNEKDIQQFDIPAKEKEIFTFTASYPYDKEFCELYESNPNRESYIINGQKLPDIVVQFKKHEINHYLLDRLIELDIIKPPKTEKIQEKGATK